MKSDRPCRSSRSSGRGSVPASDLAARPGASVRAVHRDVEVLSGAGAPVRTRHGGIRLLDGFRTDVTGPTADEPRALFVPAARGAHAGRARTRLSARPCAR